MTKQQLEQLQDSKDQSEKPSEDQARDHALRSGHKEMAYEQIAWQDAVKDFLRQSLSTKEQKTQKYYQLNLERLATWAKGENITPARLPGPSYAGVHRRALGRHARPRRRGQGMRTHPAARRHLHPCLHPLLRRRRVHSP